MFKLFYLVLFLFLNINLFALELSDEEREYIKNKKVIKVQNEKNWPPYNFNENGVPKGFSIDYTNLIAKKVGLEVEYISGFSWDEYMQQLKENRLDVINNISKNKEREEFIDFTKVFHIAGNAIYVRKGFENFDSLEKLKGKTIVMPKGFFAQQFLAKYYPDIKQILVDDSLESLRQLSLGKADATIGKKNVLDYIISTNNISGVIPSSFVEDNRMVSLIRMGVPKGEVILRDILQKAQNAVTDEELLNLKRKWFGVYSVKDTLSSEYLTKKEIDYLKLKRFFNVCSNPNITPFEFINENGNLQGMSIDILTQIEKNLPIKFVRIDSSSLKDSQEKLSLNECDLIATIDNSSSITSNATLSYPIFSYKLAIITKKSVPVVASLDEIIDKKVALKKDSLLIDDLKSNYPNIEIIETNSNHKALELVNKGEAYYTILPLPIASYYMSKFAMNDLYISRYTDYVYNINAAISNNEPQLLNIFNKAIQKITEENKHEIENRWIAVAIEKKVDKEMIIKIAIVIVLLVIVLLYRQSILNKHNNELKKAYKEIAELSSSLEKRVEEEIEKNKQKTNQLIYQSRLAQMGELINMIAHQWRQPLTAISATTNNLMLKIYIEDKIDTKELERELNLVNDYAQHLSSTIDDFRSFYKKDKERIEISFCDILDKSLNIITPSFKKNGIEIEKRINDYSKFWTYPTEINQVILNILKNSEDILVDKMIENPKVTLDVYCEDSHMCLDIKDNGGGINESYIDKIFDPYFSTKKKKDGSGIGLYMSKIIIEEHCNGVLKVNNVENGVCFKICIPKKEETKD